MIEIERLRMYFDQDSVFVTEHAAERFHQRGIRIADIRCAVQSGSIIEQYPEDYPFPSCLVLGHDQAGDWIHVCLSDETSSSRIITAYYPDTEKWDKTFRIRREK